jgi:hypothetical protein
LLHEFNHVKHLLLCEFGSCCFVKSGVPKAPAGSGLKDLNLSNAIVNINKATGTKFTQQEMLDMLKLMQQSIAETTQQDDIQIDSEEQAKSDALQRTMDAQTIGKQAKEALDQEGQPGPGGNEAIKSRRHPLTITRSTFTGGTVNYMTHHRSRTRNHVLYAIKYNYINGKFYNPKTGVELQGSKLRRAKSARANVLRDEATRKAVREAKSNQLAYSNEFSEVKVTYKKMQSFFIRESNMYVKFRIIDYYNMLDNELFINDWSPKTLRKLQVVISMLYNVLLTNDYARNVAPTRFSTMSNSIRPLLLTGTTLPNSIKVLTDYKEQ